MRMIKIFFLFMTISFSQGFLQTSGKEIVEGNGEPILLRGFGLGGWLVPEGICLSIEGGLKVLSHLRK